MGLGGIEGPPKKKLKQAQLNFCVTTERTNNKRKLSDASDGLATKLFRKDAGTPKTAAFNKENVIANDIDNSEEEQKKADPKNNVVVVIDEDSLNEDTPACEATQNKVSNKATIEVDVIEIEDDDICQESKDKDDADPKSKIETTTSTPAAEDNGEAPSSTVNEATTDQGTLQSSTGDPEKFIQGNKPSDPDAKDPTKSTDPKEENDTLAKEENDTVAKDEPVSKVESEDSEKQKHKPVKDKDQAESKLDKSVDSTKSTDPKEENDTVAKDEPVSKVESKDSENQKHKAVEGKDQAESKLDKSADSTKFTDPKEENDTVAKDEPVSKVESKDSEKQTHKTVKDKDQAESKLDKSADSDQGDMNTSVTVSSDEENPASSPNQMTTPNRKILATPKSSSKKVERERQREEKLRLKKEKDEQKRKEKEEKEKKRQEELRLKEEEKKKKEEERKRKEEAKEEERKRKEEERRKKEEAKEEERRKKEEEKKKKEEIKEEDRRKKEEARLADERKEKEKERAKAAFTKFFITEKSKPSLLKKDETEAHAEKTERPKFMPFPVKSDMRLAVQVRHTLNEEEKKVLSKALVSDQAVGATYLKELKNGRKPRTSPATWPLSNEQHDVIIVEFVDDDKADLEQEAKSIVKSKGQKAKLLQFHENRRPPYWGTWRKPSKSVGPRRPLGQDKILDYEVDSDSEWEDEEEGEDIDKEDGDSDKEEADDEEVGENGYELDKTFVRHGYLSDEEAAEAEDDDSVEDQKLKLTVLKQEFDQELKSKTQRLQPRLLGCVYISNKTLEVSKSLYEPLMKLRCKWDPNEDPIDVLSPAVVECSPSPIVSNARFPSSMAEHLAKLIHGNRSSLKALISEFLTNCDKDTQLSAISKRAVFLKVKEIAAKTYSSGSGRLVWAVNPDLCAEFGLEPIVDPPKVVPMVSPVVEPPKPKDSPLAHFLKKTSTPQGPKKRVSTTLVPRNGPSETPSSRGVGTVHIDTPRPKVTPQGSILLSSQPNKAIRRVATVLLSSVAGPIKNKTFNVGEIEMPGPSPSANLPKTITVSATVDLTDSNDGVTPLPVEVDGLVPTVLAACNLKSSPDRVAGGSTSLCVPASSDSVNPGDPAASVSANPPLAPVKDAPVSAGQADTPANGQSKPVPMETDDSPVLTGDDKPSAEAAEVSRAADLTVSSTTLSDAQPSPMETDCPHESPTPSGAKLPIVSSDAKPATVSSDAKPATVSNDARSVPSTPTPIRKKVPLVTLSKTVTKPKSTTPGQKVSIADMFCRKTAKKDTPSKPNPLETPAVVATDSN